MLFESTFRKHRYILRKSVMETWVQFMLQMSSIGDLARSDYYYACLNAGRSQ